MRDQNAPVVEAIDALGQDWTAFKTAQATAIKNLADRLDHAEAAAQDIRPMAGGTIGTSEKKQFEIFHRFLREGGKGRAAADDWLAAGPADYAAKSMAIGANETGGYAVPFVVEDEITRRQGQVNPIRELCRVVQVETSPANYRVPISLGDTASGWVGESGSRVETATPRLAAPTFPDAELYAAPKASNWSLDDIPNLRTFLATEVGEAFGNAEAAAFIGGTGSSQPKGFFNSAPVSTADGASPERAPFVLQYVAAAPGASPSNIVTAAGLVDIAYTLKSGYWGRATWLANRATIAAIRKLTDEVGRFLFEPALVAGQPATLLGLPLRISDAMPNIALNALPLVLADFQSMYCVLERPTRIIVDEVTSKGSTIFYFSKRIGAHMVDSHAAKAGKCVPA